MTDPWLIGALVWVFCVGYAVGKHRSAPTSGGARVSETPDEDPRRTHGGPVFGGQRVSKGMRRTQSDN